MAFEETILSPNVPRSYSQFNPCNNYSVLFLIGPSLNTDFKLGNQPFKLALAHPVVPYSPESLRQQECHFQKWGKTWQVYNKPLLIVGDMNSTPWSPAFQTLLHDTGL